MNVKNEYRAMIGMYIAAVSCEKMGRPDIAMEYWKRIYEKLNTFEALISDTEMFGDFGED